MIKISSHISRKIPISGLEFSSQCYSAGAEVELSSDSSPEHIQEKISELYQLLEKSINKQISEHQIGDSGQSYNRIGGNGNGQYSNNGSPYQGNGSNGNGKKTSNGNGSSKATDKQIALVRSLASELHLTADDLNSSCTRLFNQELSQITKLDASSLIQMLQDAKSGKLDVASLK